MLHVTERWCCISIVLDVCVACDGAIVLQFCRVKRVCYIRRSDGVTDVCVACDGEMVLQFCRVRRVCCM